MQIKNYTSRSINVLSTGSSIEIKQHGFAYVVEEEQEKMFEAVVDGVVIPVVKKKYKEVIGLPPEKEGVIYAVSNITAQVAKSLGRNDCVTPNTLRDAEGRIIGCSSFGYPV